MCHTARGRGTDSLVSCWVEFEFGLRLSLGRRASLRNGRVARVAHAVAQLESRVTAVGSLFAAEKVALCSWPPIVPPLVRR